MGFGGISVWQLLIVLLIVVMIFGTKKLRNMGGDVGSAVKNFKKAVKEDEGDKPKSEQPESIEEQNKGDAIDVEPTVVRSEKDDS